MQRELIKRDLVQLDWAVANQDDLFDRMAHILVERGYVKPSFDEALKTRERKYPTALPTQPEAIAIPHCDAEHILVPFIAPIRLATPVQWAEMGNNDVQHPVRFVFMLGFTKADGHVQVLQVLLENFQDPAFMASLEAASTADEYFAAVSSMTGLDA